MLLRSRVLRFVAVLTGVAAFVVVSSACSDTLLDAATVDGTHIRRDDFTEELDDLVGNDDFARLLEQNDYDIPDNGEAVDTRLASTWLSLLVQQVAIDQEFDARDLEVTDADRQAARAQINQNFGGEQVVSKWPRDFRDKLVERQARLVVVANDLATETTAPTAEEARAFYDENRDTLFACPSAKTVAHIVVATEAEAQDVLAQLQGGADFTTLAQQRSTDTTTRQQGGVISNAQGVPGCYATGASPELDAAVGAAPEGQPSGPVQTPSGFEVILVTPFTPPTFEEAQAEIIAFLQQQADATAQSNQQAALGRALERRLRALDVRVDPRYGAWVIDEQGARVEPPDAPDVRETRNKTVTPPTVGPFGAPGTPAPGQ